MLKERKRIKQSFSPFYLAILSGILLTILIINGLLEINRARNGFYLLLEREANLLLEHFEKSLQETMASLDLMEKASGSSHPHLVFSGLLFGLDESIAEYLVAAAYRIDQIDGEKPLGTSDLQSMADQYVISSIEFHDTKGSLLKGWPAPSRKVDGRSILKELVEKKQSVIIDLSGNPSGGKGPAFIIAVWRREAPGILSVRLEGEQMKRLFRQFAIQRTLSTISPREEVLFISVQDNALNILAHTDPTLIGKKEEDPFLRSAFSVSRPQTRLRPLSKGEEIFEIAKSFSFKGTPVGLIRIGYSPKEIYPVLGQIKKNVALSVLFFLILGVSAIALIWVNQNRHLKRIREMEDRIRLTERLSSLGHLAAGVAHEIRNPLNAIGMGLQRLKREFVPQEESRKEEFFSFTELILKEIRRVNEIIEQFLTLSRPFQLARKDASLPHLLKDLETLFQEEAFSQGIHIQLKIDSDLPLLKIDGEKLTQAFINIMKNGMQAMEHGGLLLIEARPFKDRVEVVISDSGAGIPSDQMEKVFNYYYTTKATGVGLGLPIAHRIIEAHDGQLKVESKVGTGTRVTTTLPLKREENNREKREGGRREAVSGRE